MSLVETVKSSALVSFQPASETLTYEPYFGLAEKPFSLNADPRFVYDSPTYRATRDGLLAGIRRREGLLVLTGEIGTGKTTLCRDVLRDIGRKTYSSMVPDPFASREDLLKMLLIDFGAVSIEELTAGRLRQASRTELGFVLAEFLDSLAADAFAVVVIDEAQNLATPLIEETRILSDTFGVDGRLQIIFVGQPELHARLKQPDMRQVDQRVCGYHRLSPLGREAVDGYIQHRLQAAGNRGDRVLFPREIVDQLHRRSGGVPRLINRVCDRALHLAFERRFKCVDQEILETALLEVGSTTLSPTWDSIMFAEPAVPPPAVAAAPAPVTPPAQVTPAPPPEEQDFEKQVDHWVEKDLEPQPRTPAPHVAALADIPPVRRSVTKPEVKRDTPQRHVKTDWPRDVRSETYLSKLLRKWAKRAAIVVAVLVAINVVIEGASFVEALLTPPVLPTVKAAPATAVAGIPDAPLTASAMTDATPAEAPVTHAPLAAAPLTQAPLAAAGRDLSGEYLVSVGLFAVRERADQLVDTLTQAGLPAMQRPFRLRRQEVQQVVLGPFFSRSDAVADQRRLQALGGYDDAKVIP